jgi:hypothetical protein
LQVIDAINFIPEPQDANKNSAISFLEMALPHYMPE